MKEKNKSLVILFGISILIIIVGYFVSNSSETLNQDNYLIAGEILKNIGFTVLTLVIISVLWNLLGGDPVGKSIIELDKTLDGLQNSVELLEDSKANGLKRIYAISGTFGHHTEWMNQLKKAEKNLDLLGYSLVVWTKGDNFEGEIINLILKGVKVRILIMDEENPELTAFMNTNQLKSISEMGVKENIKIMKSFVTEIISKLDDNLKDNLQFRTLKNGLITLQICRTDNELTMVQYIYSVIASQSPLMLIKGEESSLFKIYKNEFEKLWLLAE